MTALLDPDTGGDWTRFERILSAVTDEMVAGASVPTNPGPGPTSPGPGPEQPRRRRTDGEAVAAAGPEPLTTSPARWWPLRPTCAEPVSLRHRPLEQLRCVLSPGHRSTCLPNPREQRR